MPTLSVMRHRELLKFVADQCPLDHRSLQHTNWYGTVVAQKKPVSFSPDGYTVTIFSSKILTWYRSFTKNEPQPIAKRSLIVLQEWVPARHPTGLRGWLPLGILPTRAFTELSTDYKSSWGSQAVRHFKAFTRSGAKLRLGTKDDVLALYATSQVPKSLQPVFLSLLDNHLKTHPQDIDILVAEHDGRPIGCLVAGNCDEIRESEYMIGAFDPAYAKQQPMNGLMDWWFRRSLERGYKRVNFGAIDHPPRWPFSPIYGYSFYKIQFGVSRVWFPASYWRVL